MNILNLPHLGPVPRDILETVDKVWISGQTGAIITELDEFYIISTSKSSSPIRIPNLCGKQVIDVIFGPDFTIALDDDGKLYSWGGNDYGQLGLGHSTKVQIPTVISSLLDKCVIKIVCGQMIVMALCDNGEVFYWGSSVFLNPTKCNKENSGVGVACCYSSLVLNSYHSDDGVLKNEKKQINTFFIEKDENKVRFPGGYVELENVIEKVVCGYSHAFVLDSEGKVHFLRSSEKAFIQLDIPEKIIDIAANPLDYYFAAKTDSKTIYVAWCRSEKGIKPYPTSFVSSQEAFLTLSSFTSNGVFHLKTDRLIKKLNIDMLESVLKIFNKPELSDFTVLIGEKEIHVHKGILDARSSYFRTMFQEQWKESKEKVKILIPSNGIFFFKFLYARSKLKITNYSYEGYKTYLKYLYGMDMNTSFTSEVVIDLMGIADEYMDETLERLITMKVESDSSISRPIKLLKEIQRLPASEYEVLCKGLNRSLSGKDSSSKS